MPHQVFFSQKAFKLTSIDHSLFRLLSFFEIDCILSAFIFSTRKRAARTFCWTSLLLSTYASVWSDIRVNRWWEFSFFWSKNPRHSCVITRRTVTVTEEVCGALCAYNQPRLSSLIGAGWGYATAAVKTKLSSQKDDRPCPLNQPPHRLSALGRARPGASLSSLECWGFVPHLSSPPSVTSFSRVIHFSHG